MTLAIDGKGEALTLERSIAASRLLLQGVAANASPLPVELHHHLLKDSSWLFETPLFWRLLSPDRPRYTVILDISSFSPEP